MKIHYKVVLIIMSIFSLLNTTACINKDKAAAGKIEKFLEEKYGEEFVVYAIGGGYGTLTTNTLKADVYAKSRPDKMFDVEITKDLETIWDKYMNVLMEEKLDKVVTEMAKPIFGEELYVKTIIVSGGLSFPDIDLNDRNMDPIEYTALKSNTSEIIEIYVKTELEIDKKLEVNNIDRLADRYIKSGMRNVILNVFYIKSDYYKELPEILDTIEEDPLIYFEDKNKAYNVVWMEIEDFQKVESGDKGIIDFKF